MSAFFAMGGYGAFIWPAYALVIAVMAVLAMNSWRGYRRSQARLRSLDGIDRRTGTEGSDARA